MESLNEHIIEYKRLLEKGTLQQGYKGLMTFINDLRKYLKAKYSDYLIPSSIYQGYMDITFFAFTPKSFAREKLKIIIVFNHELFRFEIWLAGQNKNIQKQYWELFQGSDWKTYHVPSHIINNKFSIVEGVLIAEPNFNDLALNREIEAKAIQFIEELTQALSLA